MKAKAWLMNFLDTVNDNENYFGQLKQTKLKHKQENLITSSLFLKGILVLLQNYKCAKILN